LGTRYLEVPVYPFFQPLHSQLFFASFSWTPVYVETSPYQILFPPARRLSPAPTWERFLFSRLFFYAIGQTGFLPTSVFSLADYPPQYTIPLPDFFFPPVMNHPLETRLGRRSTPLVRCFGPIFLPPDALSGILSSSLEPRNYRRILVCCRNIPARPRDPPI